MLPHANGLLLVCQFNWIRCCIVIRVEDACYASKVLGTSWWWQIGAVAGYLGHL